jgi:hypothetical protein
MSQKRIIGSIVKIPLSEGYHAYARTLDEASFAIYDLKTNQDIMDLDHIISKPILFIIAVFKHAVTKGRWKNIGKVPLEERLQKLPPKFIQDPLDPGKFRIYEFGTMRNATRDECQGLECAAVWEPEQVEERINDYYAGRKNKWVESMKIK